MIRRYIIEADDSLKGFDEAIEKLEREWGAEEIEGSEDCVSREAVMKCFKKWQPYMATRLWDYEQELKNLPSVTPQPKNLSDAEINTFVESMKNMRKATKEESKSTVEYIDSISKPTGFLFDEAYEELVFVEPHKKLSINLQPCEDCVSREQAVYVASGYCEPQNIADELRKLPSVTPQHKRGKWIFNENMHDYCCSECGCLMPNVNEYYREKIIGCPYCLADMREVQDNDRI